MVKRFIAVLTFSVVAVLGLVSPASAGHEHTLPCPLRPLWCEEI